MNDRRFTPDDQEAFAALSGDYNPVHVDPLQARRLLFGRPVVHGVHLLLWALDQWLTDCAEPVELRSLKATFPKPAGVDEPVTWDCVKGTGEEVTLDVRTAHVRVAKINVKIGSRGDRSEIVVAPSKPPRETPQVRSLAQAGGGEGTCDLYLDGALANTLMPRLCRVLAADQLAMILATTRVVGMRCPGLHSVLADLDLRFDGPCEGEPALAYRTTSCDDRFSMVSMRVSAPGMQGAVRTFLRPARVDQVAMAQLDHIGPTEFVGYRALIVGGSRGLGEATAKLLAAGGAEVRITYYRGAEDADRVVDEINAAGGKAAACRFDVRNPPEDLTDLLGRWRPTRLYYFATPFIFEGVKGQFRVDLFNRFCDYYVSGFARTFAVVAASGSLDGVLYPSSVAIDEMPPDMGEYVVAKRAGEALCDVLGARFKSIDFTCVRLGRLATDQTQSLAGADNQDPAPVLLRILRS